MTSLFTPQNILSGIALLGTAFSIFLYFKDPQNALDKRQAVSEKESEGVARILEQRVQWEKESTENRFADMGTRMDTALSLAQNHTHTVDVKVDGLTILVNTMNLKLSTQIERLGTIIEERIPKK